jgi:hypothetical protein
MAKVVFGNHAPLLLRSGLLIALAAAAAALGAPLEAKSAEIGAVKNVVLVHGANTDGSGWRGVYDILKKHGYHVSIVQEPLTSLSDDVAATQRVIDRQDGPVIQALRSNENRNQSQPFSLHLPTRCGRQGHRKGCPLHWRESDDAAMKGYRTPS